MITQQTARRAAEFYAKSPTGQYDDEARDALLMAYGTVFEVRYVTISGAGGVVRLRLAEIPGWKAEENGRLIVGILAQD